VSICTKLARSILLRDRNTGTQPNFQKKRFLNVEFCHRKTVVTFFAASTANFKRRQKSINDVTPTSDTPLLDINVSGLIQHTKTNGQWPPKYVQITVDTDSNSYASAMYVYDKKPRRYAKDNRTAHLTARSDKSVAYVTNNKRLYSTFCTVEANY